MEKLSSFFYNSLNVIEQAKALLGKVLVTNVNGTLTSGRIVETEAYLGIIDKASHAYGGKRTKRTETMYSEGGTAYVYLCYGLHQMFNVVVGPKNLPHAILIRAVEPISGIETMLKRAGKPNADFSLTRGPGNVGKTFGINTSHNGTSLLGESIYLIDEGLTFSENALIATPRIGVNYAGADALLPYRFIIAGNKYVSGNRQQNRGFALQNE